MAPLVDKVCSPLSPRPASLFSRMKSRDLREKSDNESSSSSSSSSSESDSEMKTHRKKDKFKTMSSKKKFLAKLAKVKAGGFESKNLNRFVNTKEDHKVTFSPDGEIIISNVKVEIPDLAVKYKNDYEAELKKIRDLNCKEKEAISRWTRVSTVVTAVLTVLLAIGALIYIIYQAFFASSI